MSANLFANQFNIALNREAAKTVLNRSTEFSKFTVVPSHTAQSIKYSALGLKKAGGHCLEKRILGFNCREDPFKIVTNVVSLDGQYSDKAYAMPDLTALLCALIPDYMESKLEFIEVDEKDSNGALLFKPSNKGIRMCSLGEKKMLTKSEVENIFEAVAAGEVPHDQPRHVNDTLEGY
jgi:inosine-uridine nucleoside N-ribohydrolase